MSANTCPLSSDNTAAPGTETLCWAVGDFANLQIAISGIAGGVTYDVVANPGGVVLETIVADGLYAYNVVPYNRVCLVINVSGTGNSSVDAYLYNPVASSSNGCSLSFDNTIIPPSTVNCWNTQNKNTLTLTFSGIAGGAEFEVRGSPGDIVIDTVTADGDYTYNVTPYAQVCVILTVSGTGTTVIDGYTYVVAGSGISHGSLLDLPSPADDHPQYLHLPGRAGGQSGFGGTAPGDSLTLQGTDDPTLGLIELNSPIIFGPYEPSGAAYAFDYAAPLATEVFTGNFVGGGMNFSGDITFPGGTFIYESFRGAPTIRTAGIPGFAAYTVLQALPRFEAGAGAGQNPLPPLILNAGPFVNNAFAGAKTTSSIAGVNFAPTVGAGLAGATMNATTITGMIVAPRWSTVAGSTINFGTIRGLWAQAAAVGLFQPGSGLELMGAYYAVDVANIGNFGGSIPVAAVRSSIASGANKHFLQQNSTAHSSFGGSHIYFNDNFGVAMGGSLGIGDFDVWLSWNGPGGYYRTFFLSTSSALRWSSPANNRFLFDNDGGSVTGEYNWNCAKFSMGAQIGAVGNQVGVFVAGARTTGVAGGWTDFLLTQGGNLTVNHAMSSIAGWTINAPSIVLGTGSVVDAMALQIGGNVIQGTNRYGLHIISNPSGGSGRNHPLYVQSGTSRINSLIAGDPGTEGAGITIGGTTYDSALKVSNLGAGNEAQVILHRHSTTLAPVLVGSRSNTDDDTHSIVLDGQDLLAILGVGWDGNEYEIGGVMRIAVDGAPGANDMPGRFDFLTTPNGSAVPLLALRLNSNQRVDFQTSQALGGGAAATLGTIGGSGPTAAAQAQWLEVDIGGVTHWIPAWT